MSTMSKACAWGRFTSFFFHHWWARAVQEIPARLKSIGSAKPLIVTDQGIVKAGILKQITDILDNAKMPTPFRPDRAESAG